MIFFLFQFSVISGNELFEVVFLLDPTGFGFTTWVQPQPVGDQHFPVSVLVFGVLPQSVNWAVYGHEEEKNMHKVSGESRWDLGEYELNLILPLIFYYSFDPLVIKFIMAYVFFQSI